MSMDMTVVTSQVLEKLIYGQLLVDETGLPKRRSENSRKKKKLI